MLNQKFYISRRLEEWLKNSESRSIQAALEQDFGKTFVSTIADPNPPLDQGTGVADG